MVPFAVFVILGFFKVKVWQGNMDEDIYALNQLFFQLFAYLSIAEAGIGALVQKKYYSLLIDKDRETICKYYTLSKKMLRIICFIIIILGIILSFFLKALAKGNLLSIGYMQKVFILFLAKSLVEYFLFAPRFLLTADQKLYKINLQSYGYKIAETILEILLIYIGFSYITVLLVSILLRIIMNLHLNRIVFKEYPWLKTIETDNSVKLTGMSHILIFKVVSAVQENIGALLVSAFINPFTVIVYTNYKYITKYLNDFVYQSGIAIVASLGNLLNEKKNDKSSYFVFQQINTMYFFIASLLTLALSFCINPFISIWVGSDKLLDSVSLMCLLFVFFHNIARRPLYMLKDIFVLYKEMQIMSIAEAVVTTSLSFLFLKLGLGVKGILIAGALSVLLVSFLTFPIIVYKKVFGIFPWLDFVKYIANIAIIIAIHSLYSLLPLRVLDTNFLMWFLTSCLAVIAILIILTIANLLFFKSFRGLLNTGFLTLKNLFKKPKTKN